MTESEISPQSQPMVSILMVTYNHESYLAQAIEGVLAQQVDFSYELILGEDCSTDGTLGICRRYAERYPDRIALIHRERNLGPHSNFNDCYRRCRGKYIALCEGDDYWTDPKKLQKQVAAMEAHPGWSGCCHRSLIELNGQIRPESVFPCEKMPAEITLERLLQGNITHTCTMMYRGGLVPEVPDWFVELPVGDWPLHLLHAVHGPIGFLEDVMSVYRVHTGGQWSTLNDSIRRDQLVKVTYLMEPHLPEPARSILNQQRRQRFDDLRRIEARYHALGIHHLAALGKWCKKLLGRK